MAAPGFLIPTPRESAIAGLTAGADARLDENWRVGLDAGYRNAHVTVASRASAANVSGGQVGG